MRVICCDGLTGAGPRFEPFKRYIEGDLRSNIEVLIANTRDIATHQDRIDRVLYEIAKLDLDEDFILVGFSAGGSAVRVCAEQILTLRISSARLKGLVLISPAMPRGILCFTPTLIKYMIKHLLPLISSKGELRLTKQEILDLMSPASMYENSVVKDSIPISLPEANELAFRPPRLGSLKNLPILYLHGRNDRWVSPRAHAKFVAALRTGLARVTNIQYDFGHDVLYSTWASEAMIAIRCFISTLTQT